MMGAPRVLQALAADRVIDRLHVFSKLGWRGEPVRAVAVTWLLTQLIMLGGTIDILAPLMTAFFGLTFCVINLTCFFLQVASEDFSPDFELHSWWTSLLGSFLSFGAVACADNHWLITLACTVVLSLVLLFHKEDVRQLLRKDPSAAGAGAVVADGEGGEGRDSRGWGLARSMTLSPSTRMKLRRSQTLTQRLLQNGEYGEVRDTPLTQPLPP
jgi:hypothetical protein